MYVLSMPDHEDRIKPQRDGRQRHPGGTPAPYAAGDAMLAIRPLKVRVPNG